MSPDRESRRLRADPAELPGIREFVSRWARHSRLREDERHTACLLATEAVTNAIRHGRAPDEGERPITVTCAADDTGLVLEVSDRGRFRRHADDHRDDGGRGLFLMRQLSGDFRLQAGREGTRLRMRVARRGQPLARSRAA